MRPKPELTVIVVLVVLMLLSGCKQPSSNLLVSLEEFTEYQLQADERMDGLDKQVDAAEEEIGNLQQAKEAQAKEISQLQVEVVDLKKRSDAIENTLAMGDFDGRITALDAMTKLLDKQTLELIKEYHNQFQWNTNTEEYVRRLQSRITHLEKCTRTCRPKYYCCGQLRKEEPELYLIYQANPALSLPSDDIMPVPPEEAKR